MTHVHRSQRLTLSQPARYQIKVQGLLKAKWAATFDGLALTTDTEHGTTTLSGPVADQAALHGLLVRIRDLGLPLLSVIRLQNEKEGAAYEA